MTAVAPLAVSLLAVSGEAKKSGPIGLAVILVLCVACYFLFKSMSRHLRKVREDFPGQPAAPEGESTGEPAGDAPAPSDPPGETAAEQPDQPPTAAG